MLAIVTSEMPVLLPRAEYVYRVPCCHSYLEIIYRQPNQSAFNKGISYISKLMRSEKQVKEYVVSQAYDFFDDIIVMLTANVNLIHMKSLQNVIDAHLGQ